MAVLVVEVLEVEELLEVGKTLFMKKLFYFLIPLFLFACNDFGKLKLSSDLPKSLEEVSGTETTAGSELIWMLNDGGNKPKLYAVSKKGKIKKEVLVKAKNHDWEDLTSDSEGNIYIGDFGNNLSRRKNLVILKVTKNELKKKKANVEKIKFEYENQNDFPPKKKQLFYDAEAFLYFKNSLYIFTKSRVKNNFGMTSLYKIPAKEGKYKAKLISEFNNCKELECWITSADISPDNSKVVLLSQKNVLVFSDFKGDDFFSGKLKVIPLKHTSQKEGVCFKNNNTLYITDEKAHGAGGNLYELKIN